MGAAELSSQPGPVWSLEATRSTASSAGPRRHSVDGSTVRPGAGPGGDTLAEMGPLCSRMQEGQGLRMVLYRVCDEPNVCLHEARVREEGQHQVRGVCEGPAF